MNIPVPDNLCQGCYFLPWFFLLVHCELFHIIKQHFPLLTVIDLYFDLQYARETDSMLAQQRKENRSNMFVLCPHVQVCSTTAVNFCLAIFLWSYAS